MLTTSDRVVVEIVEEAQRRRDMDLQRQKAIKENWLNLKNQRFGCSDRLVPPAVLDYEVERMFSDVMADGAWKDQRCFIIGGGESLKDFDFSKLKNELVIGVNRAYEKIDCAIMFAMDNNLYRWITEGKLGREAKEKFEAFKGFRVWLDSAGYNYPRGIHVLQKTGGRRFTDSLKDGIGGGTNSGYGALNLALCLGANPIYLLGFDMKGKWWHRGYPDKHGDEVYGAFINDFENAVPELKRRGVEVINLNPKSELKCFEFGEFKDVRQRMITAITPTGDRPLAFTLCQRWMGKQTLQPDQWIVVDDGKTPLKPTAQMEYVRREPRPGDSNHTLLENLKAAIPHIKGSEIIIIEDDEYYAPGYLARMARGLRRHEVVGIGKSRYYHLPSAGNFRIGNMGHASLAETGFRSSFLPVFSELLAKNNIYLDYDIWKKAKEAQCGFVFTDDTYPLYVGIKGLPGRAGIGRGHDPALYNNHLCDKTRKTLKKWIPDIDDFNIYMDIIEGKLTDGNYQSYFPDITGITVCNNTKDLIERAYISIRKFHPYMPIVIVDGSNPGDPCASYVKSLASDKTIVVSFGYNIGHGKGMCMGIKQAKTEYALIFDSDIEMLKSPVQTMLGMMEEDTFGVGFIQKVGLDGFDYGVKSHHKTEEGMPYLHPYFQMINIKNYKKFHPYVHHGAPCYLTMRDIHKKGLSSKILKEFPGLGHSASEGYNWKGKSREYIKHETRGTRNARTRKNLHEIEKGWVYK